MIDSCHCSNTSKDFLSTRMLTVDMTWIVNQQYELQNSALRLDLPIPF